MGDAAVHQFNNIKLGAKGTKSSGTFLISGNGIRWKKDAQHESEGGRTISLQKKDIDGLTWTKLPQSCALRIRQAKGSTLAFIGFRDQDLSKISSIVSSSFEKEIKEEQLSVSGRNWGDAVVDKSSLVFRVDKKTAFNIAIPDVSQVQQGRDEVMLEFFTDEVGRSEDALMEMSFFVPRDNERYGGAGDNPACKVLLDALNEHTVDAGAGVDAVASFDNVNVMAPRGRFEVELYLSFLKLIGQNQDFRIQYEAIQRVFVLPRNHSPLTLVVLAVDPPVRKGQTHYSHVLAQFPTDEDVTVSLQLSPEQMAEKNENTAKGKLQPSMTGGAADVFARILRGLAGAKLTRPGNFRSQDNSMAVRCSYKADEGFLYPLERAFFYINKPPMLLPHDDIEEIEFGRPDGNMAASTKTFDLIVRTRAPGSQEYQFRNIAKAEWANLLAFLKEKPMRIVNFDEAAQGPGGGRGIMDFAGDDIDAGMARMPEDSEEDESFEAGSDEGDSDDESVDAEDGVTGAVEGSAKKSKKRPAEENGGPITPDGEESPSPARKQKGSKKQKVAAAADESPASGGKKPRKKKDKNAPKNAKTAFMGFSAARRAEVKEADPTLSFGDIAKRIAELWKAATPEEKAPFEADAAQDKIRYKSEMAAYKAKLAGEPAPAEEGDEPEEAEEDGNAGAGADAEDVADAGAAADGADDNDEDRGGGDATDEVKEDFKEDVKEQRGQEDVKEEPIEDLLQESE